MNYDQWLAQVPASMRNDGLWKFVAYPKALWLYDLAWVDCEGMLQDVRGRGNADQLNRSAGSICANIEEGYGRGYGNEYAYFLRVALGSARETRGWYFRGRRLLPKATVDHRISLLDEIIALLITKQQEIRQKASSSKTSRQS